MMPKSKLKIVCLSVLSDEEALVKAAKKVGFDFVSRAYDKVTVVVVSCITIFEFVSQLCFLQSLTEFYLSLVW